MPRDAGATAELNFESGHVRPLALVASLDLLFAVSTPRDRLLVFDVSTGDLHPVADVAVGFEPVAVAARVRGDGHVEAWVVNHVSDSVSVVDVDPGNPAAAHVMRTLLVGDAPRDVVFAGPGGTRAFITAAHRGQNRPGDAQPLTQEVGRADVWVFDADALGSSFRGDPLTILTLFGDTPRALAVSPDGATVYAAVFHSGSRTAAVNNSVVAGGPGLPPFPPGATAGAPKTGLIVKYDPTTDRWDDEIGRNWRQRIPFDVPDLDVFAIDAAAPMPAQTASFSGVGTTLFNLAVRPDTGAVYVSNTDARNHVRFEPSIRGHVSESRITVLRGTSVTPVHLNPHIDYDTIPGPPAEIAESLAFPMGLAFSPGGTTLYLTAFGSGSVAVLDSDSLEAGVVSPRPQVAVGGGPSGIVLDAARDRLYVMLAFDHAIATVENASQASRALGTVTPLGTDPRPAVVRLGQRLLFDARATSAHGDAACASCHVFGDTDGLAWDLGDPLGALLTVANPTVDLLSAQAGVGATYHPAKGPFLTQSLRGLAGTGPLHWRGDRSGASSGGSAYDAAESLKTFNAAFPALLGRAAPLPAADLQAFTDYVLTLVYPPNPYRPLDDLPTASMARGERLFRTGFADRVGTCNACHRLPLTTDGRVVLGFAFGQPMKVPHLRNAYEKVGLFGANGANDHQIPAYFGGDVVRGFGLEFDGSLGSLVDFHNAFTVIPLDERIDLSNFILAIDPGLKPAVGQQVTLTRETIDDPALAMYLTALGRADREGHCSFVVRGGTGDEAWHLAFGTTFTTGRQADELLDAAAVRAIVSVPGEERTGTCMLPQMAAPYVLDRDGDTVSDQDEVAAGSDPENPSSLPPGFALTTIGTKSLVLKDGSEKGLAKKRLLAFAATSKDVPAPHRIVAPARGTSGDPRTGGATLILYNASGSGESIRVPLPSSGWAAKGSPSKPATYVFKAPHKTDPIQQVTVRDDKIVVKGGHEFFAYSLDEAEQGRLALRLTLGTGVQWCTEVSGRIDEIDRFIANGNAAAPAICPAL
ncbi:hypothetical protein K2Z84_15670 [Candidatus Binatia bacterium]|nr:hypothetical protein [Candidatus Binatia bacterium]